MDKMLNVTELVKLYEEDKTEKKEAFWGKVTVHDYLPFEHKVAIAKAIIETTCIDKNTGNIHVNSPMKYMFYVLATIATYSNTEVTLGAKNEDEDAVAVAAKMANEFDTMNKSGVADAVFNRIPQRERNEFKAVMDMVYEDLMVNQYEPHAYVRELIERLGAQVAPLAEAVKAFDVEALLNELANDKNKG